MKEHLANLDAVLQGETLAEEGAKKTNESADDKEEEKEQELKLRCSYPYLLESNADQCLAEYACGISSLIVVIDHLVMLQAAAPLEHPRSTSVFAWCARLAPFCAQSPKRRRPGDSHAG